MKEYSQCQVRSRGQSEKGFEQSRVNRAIRPGTKLQWGERRL